METRLDALAVAPDTMKKLIAVETHLRHSGLDHGLLHLVKMRASQINGCAFCLHMHSAEARADGETEQRLHLLAAWRESPLFTPRERAALTWTEAVTLIADSHAPDAEYDELRRHFTEAEMVNLTAAIGMINAWNRLAISFRKIHVVGDDVEKLARTA